jgi:hypothetical protein
MSLTPRQKERRTQLLARKEHRDYNYLLRDKLRLPVMLENISYEGQARDVPSTMEGKARVQKISLDMRGIDKFDEDGTPWCNDTRITVQIFTTQEEDPRINMSTALIGPDLIPTFKDDINGSSVMQAGLSFTKELVGEDGEKIIPNEFSLWFSSSNRNRDTAERDEMPLEIRLQPALLEIVVTEERSGESWKMHVDLKNLEDRLTITK